MLREFLVLASRLLIFQVSWGKVLALQERWRSVKKKKWPAAELRHICIVEDNHPLDTFWQVWFFSFIEVKCIGLHRGYIFSMSTNSTWALERHKMFFLPRSRGCSACSFIALLCSVTEKTLQCRCLSLLGSLGQMGISLLTSLASLQRFSELPLFCFHAPCHLSFAFLFSMWVVWIQLPECVLWEPQPDL